MLSVIVIANHLLIRTIARSVLYVLKWIAQQMKSSKIFTAAHQLHKSVFKAISKFSVANFSSVDKSS